MARIANPRQRHVQGTDCKSAPAASARHGLQIRASGMYKTRIANPRQRHIQGTHCKSAPAERLCVPLCFSV